MNHSRRVLNDTFYECIYTDELASHFSDKVVLEHPYQLKHLSPVLTQNLIYTDYIAVRGNLYFILCKRFLRKRYNELISLIEAKTKPALTAIENAYAITLNKDKVYHLIAKQILTYKGKYPCFKKLLSKIHPKILIEVVHYDMDCMIANEIGRELGTVTIELQHGMMSDHIAYSYASDVDIVQFPQKIFLFSEYWKRCIRLPIASENIIATGFPYFEKKKQSLIIPHDFSDGRTNILFLSQGSIGKQLSELAVSLSHKLDADRYRILFKLHPGERAIWKELYGSLIDSDVITLFDDKYSLYDYFNISAVQVGVYSTALYEGLGFGLHTFIYHIGAADCMKDLCSASYASYIEDAAELCDKLNDISSSTVSGKEFWQTNALDNMHSEINKYLKEQRGNKQQ